LRRIHRFMPIGDPNHKGRQTLDGVLHEKE
jgi:hypothetical protein